MQPRYQTGQPFSLADFGTPDVTNERTRPHLTGPVPLTTLIPDSLSANSYLFFPINEAYDPVTGRCVADAAPFACEVSREWSFRTRSSSQQPAATRALFLNTALIKNMLLPNERAKLQFRAEFYNLFNHPNLHVNGSSTDISTGSFTSTNGTRVPGVTASFRDSRQVVLALKLIW